MCFGGGNVPDVPMTQGKAKVRECCDGAVKQLGTGMPSFGNRRQPGEE